VILASRNQKPVQPKGSNGICKVEQQAGFYMESQPLIVLRTLNTRPILFAATLLLRGTGNQLEDEESYVPNGDLRREPAIVQLVRYLQDLLADLAELLL
jgi:hypothetical protein